MIKIEGAKAMEKALRRLPDDLKRSGETAVLRAGAKPINKAAKAKVPSESGLLKKSIGINVKKVRGVRTARVGPRTGRGAVVTRNGRQVFSNPTKYSHLVEYGTSHSAAQPFIRPAVESTKGEVVGAMATGYRKHLARTAARLRKKR